MVRWRGRGAKPASRFIASGGTDDREIIDHCQPSACEAASRRAAGACSSVEIAQNEVALGVELGEVDGVGDPEGGIDKTERLLGYSLARGRSAFISSFGRRRSQIDSIRCDFSTILLRICSDFASISGLLPACSLDHSEALSSRRASMSASRCPQWRLCGR
jgi:hypothetical protein